MWLSWFSEYSLNNSMKCYSRLRWQIKFIPLSGKKKSEPNFILIRITIYENYNNLKLIMNQM